MTGVRRVVWGLLLVAVAAVVIGVVLVTRSPAQTLPHTSVAQSLRVRGNKLVFGPGAGTAIQLRGVNRSGAEYECIQPTGALFDSPTPDKPDSSAMIAEMKSWNINVVRIPLNEGCWLGINSPDSSNGATYRKAIEDEVMALNSHHLFVILALQWNSPGKQYSDSPLPMADASHSPAFWKSVASTFKHDGWVMYDLFNEPHSISWSCWLKGCTVPASKYSPTPYKAAGMQQLVNAVRSTGSKAPLMISGNTWSLDLSGIYTHKIKDPDNALVYAVHTYGQESPCTGACQVTAVTASKFFPVVYSEIGEFDCAGDYLKRQLPVLDKHGIGYLAWAWDAAPVGAINGWTCTNGPALIKNYGGTPTSYGADYKAHLLKLGEPLRP